MAIRRKRRGKRVSGEKDVEAIINGLYHPDSRNFYIKIQDQDDEEELGSVPWSQFPHVKKYINSEYMTYRQYVEYYNKKIKEKVKAVKKAKPAKLPDMDKYRDYAGNWKKPSKNPEIVGLRKLVVAAEKAYSSAQSAISSKDQRIKQVESDIADVRKQIQARMHELSAANTATMNANQRVNELHKTIDELYELIRVISADVREVSGHACRLEGVLSQHTDVQHDFEFPILSNPKIGARRAS